MNHIIQSSARLTLHICSLLCLVLCCAVPAYAADGDPAVPERIVLFAPVSVGDVPGLDKDASVRMARDMVAYVKRNRAEFSSRLATTLPSADDALWSEGKHGHLIAGAHLTLLASIESIVNKRDRFARGRKGREMVCTLNLRVLNPTDGEVWSVSVKGKVSLPKGGATSEAGFASFESKSANKATAKAMNAFVKWLNEDGNVFGVNPPPGGVVAVIPQLPLIDVKVSSTPEGAKIYVNEEFRGTTPTVVPMTARLWTMKIERSGYQPWVKEITPSPQMEVQPILVPITGAAE